MPNRSITLGRCISISVLLVLTIVLTDHRATAQTAAQKVIKDTSKKEKDPEKPKPKEVPPMGPADEYDRGTPRTSVKGFFKAARDRDYVRAAQYFDLRNLPAWMDRGEGPKLARQFKIVLDRTLWVDLELVSTHPEGNLKDGLPSMRESIGRIKAPTKTVDILLQRVQREDGVYIWKFSSRTVVEIPFLYRQFGFRPFEERLSNIFPDFTFLGWQTWQWVALLVIIGLAYLAALLPSWLFGFLLHRKDTETSRKVAQFITGPVRILLLLLFLYVGIQIIGPSVTIRSIIHSFTLPIIAFVWAVVRFVDLSFSWWGERMRKRGEETATVLLQPIKTFSRIVIVFVAILLWLDNIGFNVRTLLAGLGVGGIAVALALQDTLKNFIGSIMILLDKPYHVGQRILVKGHDGVVEEIGLRSTRIRLLTGHQTTIPNDEMARSDIENIGRRPHIRRLSNIQITYDTPLEKVAKAVKIIEEILEDHEGMDPEYPPRVYFNEFNDASLNIMVNYRYHPADYWDFQAFNQKVNMKIMQEFEKEGIKFAFPTTTTYLAQDDGKPLQISIPKASDLIKDIESA